MLFIDYPSCSAYKSSPASNRLELLFTVNHLSEFAGCRLSFRDPERARFAGPPRIITLQGTRQAQITSSPERLNESSGEYWIYNVGYRQLQTDSGRLTRSIFTELRAPELREFVIAPSRERRADLMNLARFRTTVHDAVIERYLADPEIAAKLPGNPEAKLKAWDGTYSNYDVLAVFDRQLGWDADAGEIRRHLVAALQINYKEAVNLVRPQTRDLLWLAGRFSVRSFLPFYSWAELTDSVARVEKAKNLVRWQKACEFTRLATFRRPLAADVTRQLYQSAFALVRSRHYDLILANFGQRRATRFRKMGFEHVLEITPGDGLYAKTLASSDCRDLL